MRILHILDHSLPAQDGYAYRTLNLMQAQKQAGWEVAGLTTPRHYDSDADAKGAVYEAEGLRFYRTPRLHRSYPTGLRELAEMTATYKQIVSLIETFKPDILHAHSPILTVFPALRAGRLTGIKVVYEIRAFWEDAAVDMGHTHENSLRYKVTRWLETQACQKVDGVAVICEGLRSDLEARKLNKNVHILPNCVDVEKFSPIPYKNKQLAQSLGIPEAAPVVGFIGSFYDFEGIDLLIDAVKGLASSHNAHLLLVGGGQMDQALRDRAGGVPNIIFTGRVPQQQVRDYYSIMDVLVYPRKSMRLTELVTPLKPLEAMALGKPLIASDVGGHKELIRDGETGLFFKADDVQSLLEKLRSALDSPDVLALLSANGRHSVEAERSWSRYPEIIRESGFYSTVLKS
jgi:PEP-CTERM/exosortase A-associated glycosyltransferase